MEVQAHGNKYEDIKIRELTGLGKKEYDKLKKNGYTSVFDISKGLHSDVDISIKTTGSNSVNSGDIRRMRSHSEYDIIVARYDQVTPTKKLFHTEYRFHIKPEHEELLWGTMNYDLLNEFNEYIRGYKGKEDRKAREQERKEYQKQIQDKNALMKINPKPSQHRTQCTVHIDKLIASGVEYSVKPIRILIDSKPRTFNK
tara:strand:+ start:595 stop:1191 length:597 start_codon:yes stop_codon:yes gene_type:complete